MRRYRSRQVHRRRGESIFKRVEGHPGEQGITDGSVDILGAERVNRTATTIEALGNRSEQIGAIVGTTRATCEIREMIKAIQKETGEAVRAMEGGVHEVERGAHLRNRAEPWRKSSTASTRFPCK